MNGIALAQILPSFDTGAHEGVADMKVGDGAFAELFDEAGVAPAWRAGDPAESLIKQDDRRKAA